MSSRVGLGLVLAAAVAGCDGDEGPVDPNVEFSDGEMIFSNPLPDGNTFTCSTCHTIEEPASDGFRRPGHALGGATRRASFKNGAVDTLLEAVNSCQVEWMNAEPWGPDDAAWLELFDFLDGTSGPDTVAFEIVEPPADVSGGDPDAGRDLFNASCAVCHARDGVGTQLAPSVVMRGLPGDLIARRIRTSGRSDSAVYDGLTGGVMPFWAADRLSDDEVRDLVAWIESTGAPGPSDDGPPNPDNGRGCGVTHPFVGATAELQGNSHGVAGTARIVDDCTIEITNFVFDGGGIDVRVYGGLDGDYDAGFAIGPDLTRSGGWNSETLTVQLDEGRTLDDLDGISIWCVPVGVDFGSGFFNLP